MTSKAEIIMHSAELRLEEALRDFRRAAFGDEAHEREKVHIGVMDALALHQPPAPPEVRRRLLPNWAWNKRMRGR